MSQHDVPVTSPVRDHPQLDWNDQLEAAVRRAVPDWFVEDLGFEADWTSVALVPPEAMAKLAVVARCPGVVAGLQAAAGVIGAAGERLIWEPLVADGDALVAGTVVARLAGPTRSILQVERVLLNLLGRLSGVATATQQLVDAVAGTGCRIYDTRKTVPGWRLLDKYAVRCGGGWNHRLGLFDAILIKDNHLAAVAKTGMDPAAAVLRARQFIEQTFPPARAAAMVVEIEVDTPAQAQAVLAAHPDIVLLDNMSTEELRACVSLRDQMAKQVVLEASGGINLASVRRVAETGVDRISTGMPTHASAWLDLGLDWE